MVSFHECLTAIQRALDALQELAEHPAFADDAPEYNEGGIGYETCDTLRSVLDRAGYASGYREE